MGKTNGHVPVMMIAGSNGKCRHVFIHERLLLHIAASTTPKHDPCVTKRQLAKAVGCSIWMADSGIRRLEADHLLKRCAMHGPDGSQRENRYHLTQQGTLLAKALRAEIEYRVASEGELHNKCAEVEQDKEERGKA